MYSLVAGLDIIPCPPRTTSFRQVGPLYRRLNDFVLRFGGRACQSPKGDYHHENHRHQVERSWKHHHCKWFENLKVVWVSKRNGRRSMQQKASGRVGFILVISENLKRVASISLSQPLANFSTPREIRYESCEKEAQIIN